MIDAKTTFKELSEKTLKELKERRAVLDKSITLLEQRLKEPVFESNVDWELCRLMAEYNIVWLDQLEGARDNANTTNKRRNRKTHH